MSHGLTRRTFLKLSLAGATTAVLTGCQSPRRWVTLEPYVTPPEQQVSGNDTWYATTCRQCPAACGVIVRIMNGRAIKIEGNPRHPINQGKLCAHGQASLQMLYHPDRLRSPIRQSQRGSRAFSPLTWEEALNTLFARVQAAGANLAVWCGSTVPGHLYDIFQRFSKAMGAGAPIVYDADIQLRNYHALRSADQTLFGANALPVYDLSHADLIYSFGADIFGPWLSDVRYGIEYGRFRTQPLGFRGYTVQFEPRLSMTGSRADTWYAVRPGSEGLIALAIARLIADQNLGSAERVARAKALTAAVDVNAVAATSSIAVDDLVNLARRFAMAQRPLAIPGAALAGQANAVDATTAVQALNVVAGNFGQPGGLSLSQPLPDAPIVDPVMSTMVDVQRLIERMHTGQVQVLLIYGANPAYDLPVQLGFAQAIANVPFVVSFAPIVDETAAFADLILPDRTPLESWGYRVASPNFGVPVVGSLQPVVQPLYDLRSTADVMLMMARGLPDAAQALPYADEVAMLKDVISKLPPGSGGGSGADVLFARFQQYGGWWPATSTATPPATASAKALSVTPPTFQGNEEDYPFFLNLYMTILVGSGQGAALPWLQGSPEPMTSISWQTWVQIHPDTAAKLGVTDHDVVRITSPHGVIEAPVYLYPGLRPDTIAIPVGQGHTDLGRYARNFGVNPFRLLGATAEASGANLQWAAVRVKVEPTGKKETLATFEYIPGIRQGFVNKGVPGE